MISDNKINANIYLILDNMSYQIKLHRYKPIL